MLKICMKCLDFKNKGEMGKRGQMQTSTSKSWVCDTAWLIIVNSTVTWIWKLLREYIWKFVEQKFVTMYSDGC